MPKMSHRPIMLAQDGFVSSATQQHALGYLGFTKDGRWFRYCQAGAVDLVAGNCIQGPAVIPNHLALTAAALAVNAPSTVVTPGATGGAANLYAEGYLGVSLTPGNGTTYNLRDHLAITSSVAFTLNFDGEDLPNVALTTASRYGLIHNPYKNVIQMPVTTATGVLVGVANYIISATQYGWIQTKGICSCLVTGTPALGARVMSPGTVAGSAVVLTTTNLVVAQNVGDMAQVGVDATNCFVNLKID